MYASVAGGHKSHKDTQDSKWFLLRLYYKGCREPRT